MDIKSYTLQQLVRDNTFQNWVYQSNPLDFNYWEAWIMNNPNKTELIEEATQIVRGIPIVEEKLSTFQIEKFWQELQQDIEIHEKYQLSPELSRKPEWNKIAAVFAGLMMVGSILYLISHYKATKSFVTGTNEKKLIVLPDNSEVILNANSLLSYTSTWNEFEPRMVTLRGEASFSIIHKKSNQKFIVRTFNNLNIEVLGTKFNVTSYKDEASVVLNSGKVRLNIEDKSESMIMAPGDMVEKKGEKLVKKSVNPEIYSAWKDNKLILENTSLKEVADLVSEKYGLELHFLDKRLMDKKFTGTFESDKLQVLFAALSNSFNLEVSQNDNKIFFKSLTRKK